jgi:hypothetical protein
VLSADRVIGRNKSVRFRVALQRRAENLGQLFASKSATQAVGQQSSALIGRQVLFVKLLPEIFQPLFIVRRNACEAHFKNDILIQSRYRQLR